ncbi:MAG TPA: glycosyltransferase family 4 protein, partial [Chryseosolibacter sp.]
IFHGFLPKSLVIERLKRCAALIFPSLWYEGFPIVILEAFSTGTPAIVPQLGSMPDIVQHNFNGLVFNPGDQQDLIRKIRMLKEDPALGNQLGLNARNTYVSHYTPQKNYELLLKVYEETILHSESSQKKRYRFLNEA